MCETKTEWFIIVNPRAGSGKTISGWTVAERLLRELEVPFTCAFTHYKSHARELACQAARDGYRRFVAAGGDAGRWIPHGQHPHRLRQRLAQVPRSPP